MSALTQYSTSNEDMGEELTFQNGIFQVQLEIAPEDAVRQWDDSSCECEQYHQRKTNPRCRAEEDIECRHIRESKLYAWLDGKIQETDEEGDEGGQRQSKMTAYSSSRC